MGQNDNQDVTMLKKEWFRNLEVTEIDKNLIGKIKTYVKWDKGVLLAIGKPDRPGSQTKQNCSTMTF